MSSPGRKEEEGTAPWHSHGELGRREGGITGAIYFMAAGHSGRLPSGHTRWVLGCGQTRWQGWRMDPAAGHGKVRSDKWKVGQKKCGGSRLGSREMDEGYHHEVQQIKEVHPGGWVVWGSPSQAEGESRRGHVLGTGP